MFGLRRKSFIKVELSPDRLETLMREIGNAGFTVWIREIKKDAGVSYEGDPLPPYSILGLKRKKGSVTKVELMSTIAMLPYVISVGEAE